VESDDQPGGEQGRGDQRLAVAQAAGGGSGSGWQNHTDRWRATCRCWSVARRFPLSSGEQVGPLNQFPKHAEIFKPMGFNWAKLRRVGQFNFAALIRLKPGASPVRAEAEMTAAIADAGREMKIGLGAHLVPLDRNRSRADRGPR